MRYSPTKPKNHCEMKCPKGFFWHLIHGHSVETYEAFSAVYNDPEFQEAWNAQDAPDGRYLYFFMLNWVQNHAPQTI